MFRHRDASDFSAEIEAHVQLEADRLEELGFSPEDARTAALRTFGNMTRVRERWYESGRCVWLEDCWQDLRYALRILLKNPAFSLVAVLTLTLGVGANTAMFSIVNAVLFRPIPFRDSQQLVRVFFNDPRLGLRDMPASKPELDDLLTRADVFQDATPVGGGSVNLTGAKEPQRLEFIVTYPSYFAMLGAPPQIGRLFGPQDAAAGFSPVVVISDSLWRRSFGADRSVIGRTVRLDNDAYTIIGVLQPDFYHPGVTITGNVDVFAAAGFTANPFPKPVRANRALNPGTIARLKPGLSINEAQARLTAMAAQLRRDFPADYPTRAGRTIEIQSLQDRRARRSRSGNCDVQNRCSLPAGKHSSAQPNPCGLGSAGIRAGHFRGHGFVVRSRSGPEFGEEGAGIGDSRRHKRFWVWRPDGSASRCIDHLRTGVCGCAHGGSRAAASHLASLADRRRRL